MPNSDDEDDDVNGDDDDDDDDEVLYLISITKKTYDASLTTMTPITWRATHRQVHNTRKPHHQYLKFFTLITRTFVFYLDHSAHHYRRICREPVRRDTRKK